ncbi:hypothetical protein F443_20294 [Phytophthora nicotianae P1569]|uniref:Ubiquitin-like protease family profile domain-containing protein n=1 Tax=Phytophthora nicotianae P1569 TaxID=1317065 RepID=V9E3V4_PHYNI|nr:hypothetical protein F443_20294 [Phytophthora nicotianae P1569]
MPKPKRGNVRVTKKQLRQTKLATGPACIAVHKYPSGLTVNLEQLLTWARNTPNLKFVLEMLDKYPVQFEDAYLRGRSIDCQWEAMKSTDYMHTFVIPVDLTRSLQAAIKTARKEQRAPDELDARLKKQGVVLDLVATVDPKLWKMRSKFVGALTGFHAVKTKINMWFEDRKWLEQDWRKISSDVHLFAEETNTLGLSADAICDRHRVLANEVIAKFTSSRLRTDFATLSGKGTISFENIVGGLCRGWLNDSHVDICLEILGESVGNCYVLSSLMWSVGWPSTPRKPLADFSSILHPVNLDANHWSIIIIRLQTTARALRAHVYMYEPLIDESYHEEMHSVWEGITKEKNDEEKEGLRGFLERWHQASMPNVKLVISDSEWLNAPQQPDASSCGVLVVDQANNYLAGDFEQQHYQVSKSDVKVMRLRMLWVIMHHSNEKAISKSDATKTGEILKKLQKELK